MFQITGYGQNTRFNTKVNYLKHLEVVNCLLFYIILTIRKSTGFVLAKMIASSFLATLQQYSLRLYA